MTATAPRAGFESPAASSTVAPPQPRSERLLALDVFRGLTIAGMLVVNNPGTWSAIYDPLEHAAWHGWTPTDLIFPFFLFIVGVTTHLSLSARRARGEGDGALVRQILRRGALIFLLGILLAAVPISLDLSAYPAQLAALRIPGVLQRIGVAYVIAALISLRTSARQQVWIAAALLLGYWALMTLVPVPGRGLGMYLLDRPSETLAAYVDRLLLDGHLWQATRTWDPEGPLSTIPALVTAMLGVLAGRWLARDRPIAERLVGLFAVGSIGMAVGLVWSWFFPINKNLWTSSYVLFTAGMACVVLATCIWVIDVRKVTWWTKPFVIFGVNPIAAFVGASLMARLIYTTIKVPHEGSVVPLQGAIFDRLFASWLPTEPASLLFALAYVGLWLAIMAILYRRRVLLKV